EVLRPCPDVPPRHRVRAGPLGHRVARRRHDRRGEGGARSAGDRSVLHRRRQRGVLLLVTGFRGMVAADWPDVERIYAQGIDDGEATFEAATPTWAAFDAGRLPDLRIVAVDADDRVLGWAAASAVS